MRNWPTSARGEFILSPEITITPEMPSIDGGSTNLWVAVEVTGTLRCADFGAKSSGEGGEARKAILESRAGMFVSFLFGAIPEK